MDENAIFDSLKQLRLLAVLPDEIIMQLIGRMTEASFPAGETLFQKGDPAGVLYLITDGQVGIILPHDDGSQEVLNNLGPGEAMGQMSLMDKGIRTATATAISNVQMLSLSHEDFQDVIQSQPREIH